MWCILSIAVCLLHVYTLHRTLTCMTGVNNIAHELQQGNKKQKLNSDGSLKVKGMYEKEKREGGPFLKQSVKSISLTSPFYHNRTEET